MDGEQILEQLNVIRKSIEENSLSVEERQQLYSRLAAHEKFINGNGEPGAKARLLMLEREQTELKEAVKNLPANIKKEVDETIDAAMNKTAVRLFKSIGIPLILMAVGWVANLIYNVVTHTH